MNIFLKLFINYLHSFHNFCHTLNYHHPFFFLSGLPVTSSVYIYRIRSAFIILCIHYIFFVVLQMGQLNGSGQLSQLHIGPGGSHHQASSPNLLSAASQSYQIGSVAANSAPTMITHHQLSPVSANITLMGQSNGKSKYQYIHLQYLLLALNLGLQLISNDIRRMNVCSYFSV